MGYVLSIRGYSKNDGKQIFYLEPFWWKNKEFKENPLVKEVTDEGFLDYEATLSAAELREMHEYFKPYVKDDWYQTEKWQEMINRRLKELDWATNEGINEFSHFIVGLYDWSSGM